MRLFVTGSNGYIGRNFIKKAAKKNYKIYAVTRKKKNKKIKNVKWLVGSIDKKWNELKKTDILKENTQIFSIIFVRLKTMLNKLVESLLAKLNLPKKKSHTC